MKNQPGSSHVRLGDYMSNQDTTTRTGSPSHALFTRVVCQTPALFGPVVRTSQPRATTVSSS
jgi:hypothetical protein